MRKQNKKTHKMLQNVTPDIQFHISIRIYSICHLINELTHQISTGNKRYLFDNIPNDRLVSILFKKKQHNLPQYVHKQYSKLETEILIVIAYQQH